MSILRELISRYVGWIQMGGQRASIAGLDSPLKREDTFDIDEEDMWDFDVEEVSIRFGAMAVMSSHYARLQSRTIRLDSSHWATSRLDLSTLKLSRIRSDHRSVGLCRVYLRRVLTFCHRSCPQSRSSATV